MLNQERDLLSVVRERKGTGHWWLDNKEELIG